MRLVLLLALATAFSIAAGGATVPAETHQMVLPSHGSNLVGVFYLAAGEGPHPTAIVFHGFPGYEQNLDIAQFLRAHGWNVLAMHYRGSWGVKGNFSFEHAAEDADTEVRFLLDPENAQKYRIDPHRLVVIGHSMGGYMAASAMAHNPQVAAAVLISAWNIGADYETRRHLGSASPTPANEAKSLSEDNNLTPLAGTSGMALAREIRDHRQSLDFLNLAPQITPRPVFIITASEGLAPSDHALAEALTKAGDLHVTERHWDTDHSYSGQRAELANAILQWAGNLPR
ncbi:MAG TPA: alpha/beta fold hydrolase [Acidobacteriaceae bacterium]